MDYEIQARKLAADARLRAATGTRPGPESMTKEQIATTVTAISDLMQALRYATTEDKAEIYAGLKAGTRHSISADMARKQLLRSIGFRVCITGRSGCPALQALA